MAISVKSAATHGSIESIERELKLMQATLDQLETRTATLQTQWNGEARLAFGRAMHRAQTSLNTLRALATSASSEARSSATALTDFDRRRSGVWQR